MIVVADTSPLNYLILIDEIELLPDLFEKVLLPSAVLQELKHSHTTFRLSPKFASALLERNP
jgi:predicted nucleic acid-binding protein